MAAQKIKTETLKAAVLNLVAKLDRRGWTQFEIRDEVAKELDVEVSQPMISLYLKQIRDEHRKTMLAERREAVSTKLSQYREIRKEAWLAYERSMKDQEKLVEEYGISSEQVGIDDAVTSEQLIRRIITKEGRLPDNAYLTTIMRTLEAERELLGLDETKDKMITLEQCLLALNAFKEAAKEVLSQHPDLLRAFQQRVVQVLPLAEVKP